MGNGLALILAAVSAFADLIAIWKWANVKSRPLRRRRFAYVIVFSILTVGSFVYWLRQSQREVAAFQQQKPNVQQTNQGNNNTNISGNGNTVTNNTIVIQRSDPQAKALIGKLNEFLKSQKSLTPSKLLSKYPLGYVILHTSYKETVFPYQTEGEIGKWHIDWSTFKYTENGSMASVTAPDYYYESGTGHNNLHFTGNTFGYPAKVGPFCGGGVLSNNGGVAMVGEILEINPDGVVFLFGFRHAS